MGELMAMLLVIVDAWFEIANETAPRRYQPSDRVEILGQLVRLLSHRFRGFQRLPGPDDVSPVITDDSVGLRIRSRERVLASTDEVERCLAAYGFFVERVAGTDNREVFLYCGKERSATILDFPVARQEQAGGCPKSEA